MEEKEKKKQDPNEKVTEKVTEEVTEKVTEEMVKEPTEEVEAETEEKDQKCESIAEKEENSLKNQLIRLQADFDNYKKRTQKEKVETFKFAAESIMVKLLPVIDNLERAEAVSIDDAENYRKGVQMVFEALKKALHEEGLKEIEAEGETFNPNYHHGVATVEAEDKEDQEVVEVFQKGYIFKDKVIRPAMVKICQK